MLRTVRDLCRLHGVAALYVSHDLAVVAELADRVAVMYGGRLVEEGPERELFLTAAHPYTRRLVQAIPDISGRYALVGIPGRAPAPGHRPQGCSFAPRCELAVAECVEAFPPADDVLQPAGRCAATARRTCWPKGSASASASCAAEVEKRRETSLLSVRDLQGLYGQRQVLFDIDLDVWQHECLALVGESGSGKTTLARCIAGLHQQYAGEILLRGAPSQRNARDRDRSIRREIQYIFQSPYSSLNPRRTVGQLVAQPLRVFFGMNRRDSHAGTLVALDKVSLSPALLEPYPTSSAAVSVSAWRSPGPSWRSPSSWCATRSPPPSTSPCRRRSWSS